MLINYKEVCNVLWQWLFHWECNEKNKSFWNFCSDPCSYWYRRVGEEIGGVQGRGPLCQSWNSWEWNFLPPS